MAIDRRKMLISGEARVPTDIVTKEHHMLGVTIIIDLPTGIILEAECTIISRLSNWFLSHLLVGRSLHMGLRDIINDIDAMYHGDAKNALICALRKAYDKYRLQVRKRAWTQDRFVQHPAGEGLESGGSTGKREEGKN